MKHIIALFILTGLFSGGEASAQSRDHLPYSVFGIGDFAPKGFSRNLGMGKTGIALASDLYLNNVNPAAGFLMDSISFFFTVGLKGDFVSYSTNLASQSGKDINLNNIALGFRVAKFWASSFGVEPYSTVGYKIKSVEYVEGNVDKYLAEKSGNGGLSRFYWNNSIRPLKNLSLGVSTTYLFGNIESTEQIVYPAINSELSYINNLHYNKLFADFGIQYRQSFGENFTVTLGGLYGTEHRISYDGSLSVVDKNQGALIDESESGSGYFTFPYHYGAGIAVNYMNMLTITGDYIFENWDANNSGEALFQYSDAGKLRLGLEFVPGGDRITDYFKMIRYRAGFYSDRSYITIEGNRINDTGFTLGLSFPFLRDKSTVNISLMAGQYGTRENSLIRERYASVYVSFELHDWWFLKSQYQ